MVNDGSYRFGRTNWKSPVRKVINIKKDGRCVHCDLEMFVGERAMYSSTGHWSTSTIEHINCPKVDTEQEKLVS